MTLRDVVILGGGPTGATLAALLAGQGLDVLVVERDPFPRFHVGESLLPSCMPILARLGVDLARGPFLRKAGAEFVDESRPAGEQTVTFRFSEGLPGTIDHAYQVERALFDRVLLERARALGAEVREGVQVLDWHDEQDGPRLVTTQGEVRARFGLDASGQVAFLARRRRTMAPYRDFGRAAAFCHFGPLAPDAVAELAVEGNVKVFVSPQGWGWAIPLQDGRLSVGVVGNQGGFSPATLRALVRGSPLLQRLTAGAKSTAPRMIGDFSFQNTRPYGPRWACVGDAAGESWADHGGEASWGPVKPGYDPPDTSATGLLVLAQAMADHLEDPGFASQDIDARWLGDLEDAVPTRTAGSSLLKLAQQGGAAFGAVGALEADAEAVSETAQGEDLSIFYPDPMFRASAVLAPGRGGDEDLL